MDAFLFPDLEIEPIRRRNRQGRTHEARHRRLIKSIKRRVSEVLVDAPHRPIYYDEHEGGYFLTMDYLLRICRDFHPETGERYEYGWPDVVDTLSTFCKPPSMTFTEYMFSLCKYMVVVEPGVEVDIIDFKWIYGRTSQYADLPCVD